MVSIFIEVEKWPGVGKESREKARKARKPALWFSCSSFARNDAHRGADVITPDATRKTAF